MYVHSYLCIHANVFERAPFIYAMQTTLSVSLDIFRLSLLSNPSLYIYILSLLYINRNEMEYLLERRKWRVEGREVDVIQYLSCISITQTRLKIINFACFLPNTSPLLILQQLSITGLPIASRTKFKARLLLLLLLLLFSPLFPLWEPLLLHLFTPHRAHL